MAHLSGTFTVTSTIVIQVNSTTQGPIGIDLGGSTIVSQITNGAPVIEIDVGPGVDLRYLTLSNFTIQGNGKEGDGIKIVADGNDRWVYNWNINNVTVNHVGGYGLDVQGSVFEGLVSNSWMNGNAQGGAYFAHSEGGGQVSALRWFGGGFENNTGAGLTLDNGARDMSVDGATISGNGGPGISAMSGITSVTGTDFENNHGAGVAFQNYGNFNDDTFTSTGAQTVGIDGYLAGNATLVGNTSSGADLANLQGSGSAFEVSNSGHVVNGSSVSVAGFGGGDVASISHSNLGVALPTLAPVTTAITAAVASSTGTGAVETALKSALVAGDVAHLSGTTYTVTSPIIINVTSATQAAFGIDLGGAKIVSQVSNGGPVIEIVVAAGVHLSSLTLSNFSIQGNGAEGDGIKIVADGSDRAIASLSVSNVSVEHVGGIGLDVIGNVSQGLVLNSWMNGNADGGARFANSPGGGIASGLEWEGGGFRHNGTAGMILENGTHDMSVKGAYFVENDGPGIAAPSGITLVQESGFENNVGAGAVVQGSANFTDDTFSTYGPQTAGVGGYLSSGAKVTLTGVDSEYYGSGSDPTVMANIQGTGTVAIAGGGNVVVGSNIAVTGGNPVIGVSAIDAMSVTPTVTEQLASDTGSSSNDHITSSAALTGTADPNAVIHFAVDGTALTSTATANSTGAWSFTPVGLADGTHTIVASETNAAGNTGTGSITFTLDTKAPAVTEKLASGTTTTSSAAVTGTGDPNATVHFTVDGKAVTGTATANASGAWSFTPTGLADGNHTIVASETDLAGNTGSASISFTLNTTVPSVTEKLASDTGTSSTDKITANPTLTGTADPNSTVHFTIDSNAVTTTATANSSGVWSYTPTGLANGSHTIVASETNAAGTTGSTSLTFTLDTTAPVVTEKAGSQTSSSATLTGTGDAGATVHFSVDGSPITGAATANSSGAWSYTATGLSAGSHTVIASETDAAGNTGSASVSFTLSAPPALTAALSNDTGSSATDKITSNAALTGTADAGATVHFSLDGSAIATTAIANANGVWSYTPTGLADGTHTIVASETNAAGVTGSASLTFALDTHAPVPVITGGVLANGQVTLTGTTGEANDTISVYDGYTWLGFATTGGNGAWTLTASADPTVSHSYGVNAVDLAGNEGHGSSSLVLNSTIVSPPTVTAHLLHDTGASATDHVTSSAALTGTADANAVVHFTVDGSTITQTASADSTGAWSFAPTGLADGSHTIVASETNGSGTGTSAVTFTLDTTAPAVTEHLLSGGPTTSSPALVGTSDAGAIVHFTVDGSIISSTATADAAGAWSFTPSSLADGTHTVVATETDLAGNTGSASVSFTLDTHVQTDPAITGMTSSNGILTLSGSTGEAGDNISLYDGDNWIGWTTTDASGHWSYQANGDPTVAHSFGFNTTDLAGNISGGSNTAIMGSTVAATLTGSSGNDIINAGGGSDIVIGGAGADKLTGGTGKVAFTYNAAAESTATASDTITDFHHGYDRIDFTNIGGINASSGVPQFQGNITGSGNLTLAAHSVAFLEVGGNTQVLVNTTSVAETVSTSDTHAANMQITLLGVNLGLTGSDFHHA
ncbi:Ig-like domain (group 3) [Enhydrobacter aerosaccus]|uniref:Ig-like domain (Group 3) n=2 Tax=Enhydrobacter aerosaccus TaxID=225324 RepID=A0A1T4JSD0_9HYPH|nr:Ig-like domain (group 3) [Enhydrobacter aerosaccus]